MVAGKKNMFSVMANSGFGVSVLITPENLGVIIPPKAKAMRCGGIIKQSFRELLSEGVTMDNVAKIENEFGVKIFVAGTGTGAAA